MNAIKLAIVAAMVLPVGGAHAQRPATSGLTCPAVKALVRRNRAVVLQTGPRTYRRFVRSRADCRNRDDVIRYKNVPTRSRERCQLLYCEPYSNQPIIRRF